MGVYANTEFAVECESQKSAQEVLRELKRMKKDSDENGNFQFRNLSREKKKVFGFLESGRVQNLEWQCEQVWDRIEPIKGVIDVYFPFMIEGEGMHFEKELD